MRSWGYGKERKSETSDMKAEGGIKWESKIRWPWEDREMGGGRRRLFS